MLGRWLLQVLAFGVLVVLVSCAGRGGVSISVSPSEVTLAPGESVVFTATVVGAADKGVTWSATGGQLVPSGLTAVFTAPVEVGEYSVTATSAADQGRWASAVVLVEEAQVGEYPYGDPVLLGEAGVELLGEGVRVLVPGVSEGVAASVELAVVDSPMGVDMPLVGLSRVVALRLSGDLLFVGPVAASAPLLELELAPLGVADAVSVSSGGFEVAQVVAWVWTRVDEGPWLGLAAQAVWDEDVGAFVVSVANVEQACLVEGALAVDVDSCEFAWQIVDVAPLVAAEDSLEEMAVAGGSLAPLSGRHTYLGLHQVNLTHFLAAGASCDGVLPSAFLTHESERHLWSRSARTAVVFVHGWQVLSAWMKLLDGDTPSVMPAHCETWEQILGGVAGAGGPWQVVRDNADVFTFRYNSNRRVSENGSEFAVRLSELRDFGYERLVLVGHSMGGLVVHDARQRAFLFSGVPFGPADLPVVTLATPYMGGPLLCTEVSGGVCQYASTKIISDVFGTVPVLGLSSTYDLTTALDVSGVQLVLMGHHNRGLPRAYEKNPYLLRLWEPVNMLDANLTAFVGSSASAPYFASVMYGLATGALTLGWGANDGIVPLASGRAAIDHAHVNPIGRLANRFEYGRDHGHMTSGCLFDPVRTCPSDGWVGDPYLDAVAARIGLYLLPSTGDVSVSVEPESVTISVGGTQSFTANVRGAADTSVWWSVTCGSIGGSGNTITYMAPDSVGTCLVRATSTADGGAWDEATVTVVESPPTATTGQVAGGSLHSLAVREDGTVWAWGRNRVGQLGDGSTTDRLTPVQVVGLLNVRSVSAAWETSLAVREDGTVWAWGANYVGQLGDGSTTDRLTPVQVVGLSNVRSVSASWEHSLAVREDGTVWAWGANYVGQLGDGSTSDRLTPVQVVGLSNVRSVSAGSWHSLAVRDDGTVWAWGGNRYGPLGDGSTTDRSTPVQVTGMANVRSVASGHWFSVAVREDGTAWAWGANDSGQLGDGTTTDRLTPVQVVGLSEAQSVSAGWLHSLVVRADGTVWAWGDNLNGQLGDGGSSWSRFTPAEVTGLSAVRGVSAGWEHSLAVRDDGTFWGWGCNSAGQVGDGTTTDRFAPVQIIGF